MATKTVILYYQGNYAKKEIYDKWAELNLPLRHISSYIKGADEEDSDEMIKFIPSGKYAKTKDGNRLEVWTPKAKQLRLDEIERSQ